jgi:hypothetical protein
MLGCSAPLPPRPKPPPVPLPPLISATLTSGRARAALGDSGTAGTAGTVGAVVGVPGGWVGFQYPSNACVVSWTLQSSQDLVNWVDITNYQVACPGGDVDVPVTNGACFYRMKGVQ